jgi:hypothetical protein
MPLTIGEANIVEIEIRQTEEQIYKLKEELDKLIALRVQLLKQLRGY